MTGCDFLWAACGVVGAVCRTVCAELCVACVLRCACGDDCAVRSGCGCAGCPVGVRGLCVCMLRASVWCAVRCLFSYAFVTHATSLMCHCAGLGSLRRVWRVCPLCDAGGG